MYINIFIYLYLLMLYALKIHVYSCAITHMWLHMNIRVPALFYVLSYKLCCVRLSYFCITLCYVNLL